jgi:hypothetical protein
VLKLSSKNTVDNTEFQRMGTRRELTKHSKENTFTNGMTERKTRQEGSRAGIWATCITT